jgi:hypothetical protein
LVLAVVMLSVVAVTVVADEPVLLSVVVVVDDATLRLLAVKMLAVEVDAMTGAVVVVSVAGVQYPHSAGHSIRIRSTVKGNVHGSLPRVTQSASSAHRTSGVVKVRDNTADEEAIVMVAVSVVPVFVPDTVVAVMGPQRPHRTGQRLCMFSSAPGRAHACTPSTSQPAWSTQPAVVAGCVVDTGTVVGALLVVR